MCTFAAPYMPIITNCYPRDVYRRVCPAPVAISSDDHNKRQSMHYFRSLVVVVDFIMYGLTVPVPANWTVFAGPIYDNQNPYAPRDNNT